MTLSNRAYLPARKGFLKGLEEAKSRMGSRIVCK